MKLEKFLDYQQSEIDRYDEDLIRKLVEKIVVDVNIPYIPNFPQYKQRGAFVEEYENALVLNKMLKEFRKICSHIRGF